MEDMMRDPNGYSPSDIVNRLVNCISSGYEGINYTVIPRDKNEKLFKDYAITSTKRREILKSLTINDYKKWEPSDNPDYDSLVYFFEKTVKLIPRYIEDASEKDVDLYIKVSWDEKNNNLLFIISFHEKEY